MRRLVLCLLFALHLGASTLHLALSASPSRINPLLATDSASAEIAGWIFNGLFKYDEHGRIVGDLARSWEFVDPRHLRIELRRDVRWHDGEPFGAQDVLFTYKLITSPKIFTPYASDFRAVEKVEALGSHTILVTYKRPYFKALQIWMLGIVPKHILEHEKDIMTSSFNQHPVGTGPYKLQSFSVSQDITLHANSDYFEHEPHIDTIVYHFLPDPSTQFLMLKSHKLDVGGLSPLQYERQIDAAFRSYYKIYEQMSHGYTYLGFNLARKKFRDIRVRKAIDLAIDKKLLVDLLFFSHARICTGPFMPGTFAYDPAIAPRPYDPRRAKELLAEAGYDEKHPLQFEIATNSNNSLRMYAAQIIQYQLAKIGVKVTIRAMEWQAFLNTVVTPRKFDTILLGWSLGLTPDAYSIWHSSAAKLGGFNLVSYKNPEVDRLIEEAEVTIDQKRLAMLYRKIFDRIVADVPYVFLYIPNAITAVNAKIRNVRPSIVGIMHNEIDWIKP